MTRRMLVRALLLGLVAAGMTGDALVHAATCTPKRKGTCRACRNCRACAHCSKNGGTCSVCG